jgi:hypothetical protein
MKPFDRIIVVTLANQCRSDVLEHSFFNKLAKSGAYLKNYFGVNHPAQPNLLASISGETCGITNNLIYTNPFLQKNIVDLLEAQQVSWKSYVEDLPNQPWSSAWESPRYPTEEVPFVINPRKDEQEIPSYFRYTNVLTSFHNVQKSEARWNKIVHHSQFWKDIDDQKVPECIWYTPNIWNRGDFVQDTLNIVHSRVELIPQQAAWLEIFFGNTSETGLNLDLDLLLENPKKAYENSKIPKGTLLVLAFDEAPTHQNKSTNDSDAANQVYTVLLGDMIQPGTVIETPYNHYSLLRTIEENFQLGTLQKNDEHASWFQFLWKQSFSWSETPVDTGFEASNTLAITHESTGNHMVFTNATGDLFESFQTESGWSKPKALDIFTDYPISLATIGDTTFLMYQQPNKELLYRTYNVKTKEWSQRSINLGFRSRGSFDLISFFDATTREQKLILCWIGSQNEMEYMLGAEHGFDRMIFKIGQQTDGNIKLGQLGASLYLIYKEQQTEKLRITTYNTATFNEVLAIDMRGNPAEENNAMLNCWPIADFEVTDFSKDKTVASLGSMALAAADGHLHFIYGDGQSEENKTYTSFLGFTGILTPLDVHSNGYGTLKESGWTKEKELPQVSSDKNSSIALSSNGKVLTFAWIDTTSGTIKYLEGGYNILSQ